MKVLVLEEAESEAFDAALWYEEHEASLADAFLEEYQSALDSIEEHPERFGRLETVTVPREIRRVRLRRFPYLVVYELFSDRAVVLAVPHVSRRPNYWINRG